MKEIFAHLLPYFCAASLILILVLAVYNKVATWTFGRLPKGIKAINRKGDPAYLRYVDIRSPMEIDVQKALRLQGYGERATIERIFGSTSTVYPFVSDYHDLGKDMPMMDVITQCGIDLGLKGEDVSGYHYIIDRRALRFV